MSTTSPPSLLSLSIAAASADPIHIASHRSTEDDDLFDMDDADSFSPTSYTSTASITRGVRESSVGGLGSGMGDLTLGSPPPETERMTTRGAGKARVTQIGFSVSPTAALASSPPNAIASSPPTSHVVLSSSAPAQAPPGRVLVSPIHISKTGKKRGVDHRCESCDKVYRHPSCLIKHRWEHTPHWRESSKYVLSKHQQVQLLEAAAILSHLNADVENGDGVDLDAEGKPKKERLPEDRSLWPSFLSGGSLPSMLHSATTTAPATDIPVTSTPHPPYSYAYHKQAAGASTSVPTAAFLASGGSSKGPRMHSYTTTNATAAGIISGSGAVVVPKSHTPSPASFPVSNSVVEVRPGVIGVAHSPKQQHPIAASLPSSSVLSSSSSKKAALSSSTSRHRSSRSLSSRDTKEETLGIPVPNMRTRGLYKHRPTRSRSRSITTTTSTSFLSTSVLSADDVSEVAEDEDMSDVEVEPKATKRGMPGLSLSYSSSSGQSGAKRSVSPDDEDASDIDVDEGTQKRVKEEEDGSDIEVDIEASSPAVYGSYPYPYSAPFHRHHQQSDSSFEARKDRESAVRGVGAARVDWEEELEMEMDMD